MPKPYFEPECTTYPDGIVMVFYTAFGIVFETCNGQNRCFDWGNFFDN